MKTAFPFPALEIQKHFTLAIEVAKPFAVFSIGKVIPGVVMDFIKPIPAFLKAR